MIFFTPKNREQLPISVRTLTLFYYNLPLMPFEKFMIKPASNG